ncbi:unnamed protein product [Clonostachys rosea]|uniref:Carrier domain-containing protein n=1 Tax=Bionectria ochroleuca TaxID=29856 RepID=A0ABY6U4V5_BIOOC|nr:unnamed protein product [Clonostachys rosea]
MATHGENGSNGSSATGATSSPSPIAIVGLSCKFGGDASTPHKLWEMVTEGRNCWSPIPESRFDAASYYNPDKERRGRLILNTRSTDKIQTHAQGAHFLAEDIGNFDAAFFNLSTEIASGSFCRINLAKMMRQCTDPQVRLVLEGVYEAVENAGIPMDKLSGTNTSVFSGVYARDYNDLIMRDPEAAPSFLTIGTGAALMSNRVSHFYDFRGASLSADTGCSSGLVVLHQAVSSLRNKESETAIVAASAILLNPDMFVALSSQRMIGSDGRVYAWDDRAQGYARGEVSGFPEGVATLVLKPLDAALRDGDNIRAVIRETALNQDGRTTTLTSPSGEAQEALIKECYARAGLNIADTPYVEAHMTGTLAGDKTEAEALSRTFGKQRREQGLGPIIVGGVKTNIGHTEPVSGLAAIVKSVFMLENQIIPPNVNYKNGNPEIPLHDWNLKVPLETVDWPEGAVKRISVNNFGYGGTNAHVILDQAPVSGKKLARIDRASAQEPAAHDSHLFVVSAKDPVAATGMANKLAEFIRETTEKGSNILPADLAYTLSERRALLPYVIALSAPTLGDLAEQLASPATKPMQVSQKPTIGFVFNGQGAQWHAMGRELIATYQVFRDSIEMADKELNSFGASWSLIGILTKGRVIVACVNSPESVTLSGDMAGIEEVELRLKGEGVFARKLKVPMAYHSHHMQRMAQAYQDSLDELLGSSEARTWNDEILFYSPVTGGLLTSPKSLEGSHWVKNLVSPVLFSQSFDAMCFGGSQKANLDIILEVGAHGTLAGPIRQIVKNRTPTPAPLPYVSCLKRGTDAVHTMQEVASFLVSRGAPLKISAVNAIRNGVEAQFIPELPTYAWNHTRRYWIESRLNREFRFPGGKPHELLGLRAAGSNGLTPTFRQFLRLGDLPWLQDHQLEGSASEYLNPSTNFLPGAGYVTLAIEAVRRVTDLSEESITGYHLRDVDIANALNIPEDSTGLEIQLCLRPCDEKYLDHKNWWEFELCSCGEGGNWTKHGRGFVLAEIKKTTTPLAVPDKSTFLNTEVASNLDPEEVFASLRQMNFYHGPQFQNLLDIQRAEDKSITNIRLAPFITEEDDYVMHPTTLDSVVVASYNVMDPKETPNSTIVPRGIRSMYMSKNTARFGTQTFQAFTQLLKQNKRGFETSVIIRANDSAEACIVIDGLQYQAIPRASDDQDGSKDPVMVFQNEYELDITRTIPELVKESMKIALGEEDIAFEKKLDKAAYFIISEALAQLNTAEADEWDLHHRQFFDWMKATVAAADSNQLAPGSRAWSKTSQGLRRRLLDEVTVSGALGALLTTVGTKLASIIMGQDSLASSIGAGSVAQRYHHLSAAAKRTHAQLHKSIQLYAAKNPGSKVLEIGGGRGSLSKVILSAAQNERLPGVSLFSHYDFTDLSSDEFDAAQKELARWESILTFKAFDARLGLAEQSFEKASYDLIVSSLAPEAVDCLPVILSTIKTLLKPNGQLILVVPTKSRLIAQVILGSLPTSWPENNESGKPSIVFSNSEWEESLEAAGFSKPQIKIDDCEDASYQSSNLIMATATSTPSFPSQISIVHAGNTPPEAWSADLQQNIQELTGVSPAIESLSDVDVQGKVCIVTAELAESLIDNWSTEVFEKVRNMMLNARGVMWLTAGGIAEGQAPHLAQIQGVLRTLKQEDASIRRVHLDFNSEQDNYTSDKVQFITQVFQQSFDFNIEDATVETEYAIKDGYLRVPRIYHDLPRDKETARVETDPEPVLKPWKQEGVDLFWERGTSGLLSQTYFVDKAPEPEVPEGEVEIEIKAFGLNFRDVLLALGQLDDTHTFHESCGVVTRLGPNTEESGLKVGDRVCQVAPGFGTKVTTKWTSCARIPDLMSFEEGAAIVVSYVTGYLGLVNIARLEKGETILIHAATGAAGQAALMLAQHIGAEVFVTCSSKVKREFLQNHYSIPADHIFNSRDASFGPDVLAATGGKGVDVIYNSLAGNLLKTSWECLGRFGRFVEIGKMDLQGNRNLEMSPFLRMASFTGLDVIQIIDHKPRSFHHALTTCLKMYEDGQVKGVAPITTYPISEMEAAMRLMQSGGHMGKIVLVPGDQDLVKVVSRPRPVQLDGNSTYLVAGNIAGIGSSIVDWMVERGAKSIVIVSRSVEGHSAVPALVQSAADKGCKLVARNCDISSEESVIQLADYCAQNLPPVRGVIVAAMVLDDTVFETLKFEQWRRGILPKVAGSWNLHKHFEDLSFFTMFSSIVGVVGHASQAAYAAGNAFQDALAKHRVSLGLPAASLDLGAVLSVGYAAEAGDSVMNNVTKLGTTAIEMDHVMRIVENSIRESSTSGTPARSQYITSISPYDTIPEAAVVKTDRRFGTLRFITNEAGTVDVAVNASTALKKALASGKLSKADAAPLITTALMDKLADLFSLDVEGMDASLPMSKYGLDSLVAVELRNWLSGTVKAKVTIFEILQSPSFTEFGALVASKSELLKSSE